MNVSQPCGAPVVVINHIWDMLNCLVLCPCPRWFPHRVSFSIYNKMMAGINYGSLITRTDNSSAWCHWLSGWWPINANHLCLCVINRNAGSLFPERFHPSSYLWIRSVKIKNRYRGIVPRVDWAERERGDSHWRPPWPQPTQPTGQVLMNRRIIANLPGTFMTSWKQLLNIQPFSRT